MIFIRSPGKGQVVPGGRVCDRRARSVVTAWPYILRVENFPAPGQVGKVAGPGLANLASSGEHAPVTAALREAPLSASLVDGYSARHLTVLEGLDADRISEEGEVAGDPIAE